MDKVTGDMIAQGALMLGGSVSLNYALLLERPSLALVAGVAFAAGLWVKAAGAAA